MKPNSYGIHYNTYFTYGTIIQKLLITPKNLHILRGVQPHPPDALHAKPLSISELRYSQYTNSLSAHGSLGMGIIGVIRGSGSLWFGYGNNRSDPRAPTFSIYSKVILRLFKYFLRDFLRVRNF